MHTDSIHKKIGQDVMGGCLGIHLHVYSNAPFVCFCSYSDGTFEILISMSMHMLGFKNTSLTEQNMKKLVINCGIFWRRMLFFFSKCEHR